MQNIETGLFQHTLVSALSCVLLMAVAGVLVSICSFDSLVESVSVLLLNFEVCKFAENG